MPGRSLVLIPLALLAFFVTACGGGGDEDPTPTSTSTGSPTGSTGFPEAGPISSFQEIQPAIIQIVSQGTFRDPELGLSDGSGAGSGFIISEDGLAITNNHVVAGAATIEVFIGGDDSRGYNASIVGVSECNDLALIDIRESEPLPFLGWHEGEVIPGTGVYTAGFPLGDPEFTLTRGIVSKARASGESDWSSLDYSIEHDATIQGGNSGGPLVTAEGKVLGINYASSQGTNSSIYYAIPAQTAKNVLERLKDGDYETIGVNAWAVYDEELNISGIWVAGVAPGSPAADAGIQAGDIITTLNGLPMALDGTMADYCDVFRTHGDDNPMAVEVLRYDTGEILKGEINGDEPIEIVFSPADEIQGEVEDTTGGATTYSGYTSVTDDTGRIIVDIPRDWTDVDTRPCNYETYETPCVLASTNLDAYRNNEQLLSGMAFVLFEGGSDIEEMLEANAQATCEFYGTYEYSDPVFTGGYDVWENCGGAGIYRIVLAAVPEDQAYTAVLIVTITIDADWDALDQMFATFNVMQP